MPTSRILSSSFFFFPLSFISFAGCLCFIQHFASVMSSSIENKICFFYPHTSSLSNIWKKYPESRGERGGRDSMNIQTGKGRDFFFKRKREIIIKEKEKKRKDAIDERKTKLLLIFLFYFFFFRIIWIWSLSTLYDEAWDQDRFYFGKTKRLSLLHRLLRKARPSGTISGCCTAIWRSPRRHLRSWPGNVCPWPPW